MNSIFKYIDYRNYILNKAEMVVQKHGYKAQLAQAAGCQRSYFSQVLNETADLLPEHCLGLSEFWNHSPTETEYFLNMVLYSRAGTKKLKTHFKEKLEHFKKEQENLAKRITDKVVLAEEHAAIFYSNWQYLAITILISIPAFRKIAAISERLNLSEKVVKKALIDLEKLGMVYKSSDDWLATSATIHVPRESSFNAINHSHWRNKAVENAFISDEDSVHYTSVCTLSKTDVQRIKEMILQLIDESRTIVGPSKEEEIYCLTCDWFKI